MTNKTYRNLSDDFLNYNAWKSEDSFPVKSLDEINKMKALSDYEIIEYIHEGILSNRTQENFDNLITQFKKEVWNLIKSNERNIFLFNIEHSSESKSAIRSYKGIIDKKKIEASGFIQRELVVDNKETRFAFVAECNQNNFDYLCSFLFDYSSSFIISTKNDYLNEIFIENVTNLFELKGWTHINLLRVMFEFCNKDNKIYRIGGNDGEEYWSLQEIRQKIEPIQS